MEKNRRELSINHDPNNREVFTVGNPNHVNLVINDLLKDIENVLRFKVKNYVMNYLKLTEQDDGEWQNCLEYGTNDKIIIEFQKIGFERQIAIELSGQAEENFEVSASGEIIAIDTEKVMKKAISPEAKTSAVAYAEKIVKVVAGY